MSSSSVTLGPSGQPRLYRGRVVALNGNRVVARLASTRGAAVLLRLAAQIDASGAVAGRPAPRRRADDRRARATATAARRPGRRDADARRSTCASTARCRRRTRGAGPQLLDLVERSGLRGRGGAARLHRPEAARGREPPAPRDRGRPTARRASPRAPRTGSCSPAPRTWCIDGAVVAATAVGADEAILYVKRSDERAWTLAQPAPSPSAIAPRRGRPSLRLVAAPHSYVSGQETRGDRAPQRPGGAARRPSRRARSSAASAAGRRWSATSRRSRTWR